MGWFGRFAYIYLEVGGGEIPDEAVVATYASVFDTDYTYKVNVNITAQYQSKGDFETAECRVIFKHDRDPYLQYASYDEVDVRTYKGSVNSFGIPSYSWETDTWDKSASFYDSRYQQEHRESGWEQTSRVGCYMQRLGDSYYSAFPIKNNVAYPVVVGYNLYNKGYSLQSDTLLDEGWSAKIPVFAGQSEVMEFTWWNVEGAFTAFTAGIAAIVAVLAF